MISLLNTENNRRKENKSQRLDQVIVPPDESVYTFDKIQVMKMTRMKTKLQDDVQDPAERLVNLYAHILYFGHTV